MVSTSANSSGCLGDPVLKRLGAMARRGYQAAQVAGHGEHHAGDPGLGGGVGHLPDLPLEGSDRRSVDDDAALAVLGVVLGHGFGLEPVEVERADQVELNGARKSSMGCGPSLLRVRLAIPPRRCSPQCAGHPARPRRRRWRLRSGRRRGCPPRGTCRPTPWPLRPRRRWAGPRWRHQRPFAQQLGGRLRHARCAPDNDGLLSLDLHALGSSPVSNPAVEWCSRTLCDLVVDYTVDVAVPVVCDAVGPSHPAANRGNRVYYLSTVAGRPAGQEDPLERETILFDVAEHIATITLNRPDSLNSFNDAMAADMTWAWETVHDTDDIYCVVLQANGDRAFCTGTDIREPRPMVHEGQRLEQLRPRGLAQPEAPSQGLEAGGLRRARALCRWRPILRQ